MTARTAWRACRPDLRSSHGYRWPWPGNEATAPLPDDREFTRGDPCPRFIGDGLCLAKTWRGAASGSIPAITCLLVEFDPGDVLGEDDDKVRVSRCRVVDVFDGPALIRDGWCRRADLGHANLRHANLRGADLGGADLRGADLGGADLGDANLRGANLGDANLRGADLRGANLRDADLRGANLGGADLRHADLGGADLRHVNLWGADLRHANLGGADLRHVNLWGADLRVADLRHANLGGAVANKHTVWPDGFDPAARGVTVR